MKRFLLTALFVLIGSLAFAQELIIVIAPFDVRAGSGFSKTDAETIEYLLLNELSKSKTIKVLDQSDAMFKETIKRMEFELSDWSNPNKVADFGKALNANAILLGRMMTLGNELIIAVRINDLNTEVKAANDLVVTSVGEVRGKLPVFTAEIINRLPKPPPPPIKTYEIGDRGPGGGFIFFAEGNHYKECSPNNIGKFPLERAIELAESYRGSGFNNWRIPSHDELDLMYMNLKKKGKGNFTSSEYWSGNGRRNIGYTVDFGNGRSYERNDRFSYTVRAVRDFYER
jgi:TolB-like protein